MKKEYIIVSLILVIFLIATFVNFYYFRYENGFVNSVKEKFDENIEKRGLNRQEVQFKLKERDEWKSIKSWRCRNGYWIVEGKCEIAPSCLGFYTQQECEQILNNYGKFERLPDTIVKIKPTQCAELSWNSIEDARNYFELKGIKIYDVLSVKEDIAVCEACYCMDYDTYYFLISRLDLTLALENYLEKTSCNSEFKEKMCEVTGGSFINGHCQCSEEIQEKTILVMSLPTQCAERAWKNIDEAVEELESMGITIFAYYDKLDTERLGDPVCEACDCNTGYVYYFKIYESDFEKVPEGWFLIPQKCSNYLTEIDCEELGGFYYTCDYCDKWEYTPAKNKCKNECEIKCLCPDTDCPTGIDQMPPVPPIPEGYLKWVRGNCPNTSYTY